MQQEYKFSFLNINETKDQKSTFFSINFILIQLLPNLFGGSNVCVETLLVANSFRYS